MTTKLVLAGLLIALIAQSAVCQPILRGSVDEQNNTTIPSKEAQPSTSLGRSDVETTSTLSKPAAPAESKEVQLAWDAWHKRLAEAIFYRFDILAYQKFQDSPPLGVKIRYVVTKEGGIVGLKIIEKSTDMMFDALACQAIMWQARKPALLKFPEGSNRYTVEKFATFTQNTGDEGYQTTEGDKETVRVQQ